jgi:hypothetical protein
VFWQALAQSDFGAVQRYCEGSHRQLLALGRKYAELFELQEAGYR